MVSAAPAEHDSVGRLLECRYAGTTSEVIEALREQLCRSIEYVDVVEREGLAGFAAPLDSYLRVTGHDSACHSADISRLEGLAATVRKYCRLGHISGHVSFANQRNHGIASEKTAANTSSQFKRATHSDCLCSKGLQPPNWKPFYFMKISGAPETTILELFSQNLCLSLA